MLKLFRVRRIRKPNKQETVHDANDLLCSPKESREPTIYEIEKQSKGWRPNKMKGIKK